MTVAACFNLQRPTQTCTNDFRRLQGSVSYRLGDVLRRSDLPEFQVAGVLRHGLAQLTNTYLNC